VAIRLLSALEAEGTSGDATDCSDSIPRQRPQSVKQAADFRCVRISDVPLAPSDQMVTRP